MTILSFVQMIFSSGLLFLSYWAIGIEVGSFWRMGIISAVVGVWYLYGYVMGLESH